MKQNVRDGFTIVELLVVIVVIAILASILVVTYGNWREKSTQTTMESDLHSLAAAMEDRRNFTDNYPTAFPGDFKPSNGNILQLVGSSATYYCADIYNTSEPSIILSYDSASEIIRAYPCSGTPTGNSIGGTVPSAPRGTNLSGDFSNWQLNGTASVSNGVLTLGTNGYVVSPPIRVSAPVTINAGGDMLATQQATAVSLQPNAGQHITIYYYGSDGSTAVTNSSGVTANGCARSFTKGSWQSGVGTCVFNGGPNVIYVRLRFYSSASSYSSPDWQVRNPLLRVSD